MPSWLEGKTEPSRLDTARKLIEACQRDLNRTLSIGEQRDLLMDNTPWTYEQIKVIVDRLASP